MKHYRLSVGQIVIACSFALCGYSQSLLTEGLVAYYPFDGDASDGSPL